LLHTFSYTVLADFTLSESVSKTPHCIKEEEAASVLINWM